MKMSTSQAKKALSAYEVLRVLTEELSDTMSLRQATMFLAVALRAGEGAEADIPEIAGLLKVPPNVVSRDLIVLGERLRNGEPGYDLISVKRDYRDMRRRPYVLTKKGESVIHKILEVA